MSTITVSTDLVAEECCNCGVWFAVPRSLMGSLRRTKTTFYCPNGHPQSYTRSEADKLRDKLNREIASHDRTHTRLREVGKSRDAAERREAAHKGVATRMRNRASNGLCPCCNRSFVNLKRHMGTKHPDYSEASN